MKHHKWESIAGHMYDAECLFLTLIASGRRVLEIGTHHGRSTAALAESALSVITIDTYLGDPQIQAPSMETTKNNLSKFDNVTMVVGDWREYRINLSQFDMIFYDGCHTEEAIFLSTLYSFPGVIALHDYKLWDKGMAHVVKAVDDFSFITQRPIIKGAGSIVLFAEL